MNYGWIERPMVYEIYRVVLTKKMGHKPECWNGQMDGQTNRGYYINPLPDDKF